MNKCMCDLCKEKEADSGIKAKRRWIYGGYSKGNWVKVDICTECFWELFKVKRGRTE